MHGTICTEIKCYRAAVYNAANPDVRPKLKSQTFKILTSISIEPNTAEFWLGLLNAMKYLPSVSRTGLSHLLRFAKGTHVKKAYN